MEPARLHGAMPALVTPLGPDRDLDEDGLRTLVARVIADGAIGVLVAGSTGEGTLLEPEQRVRLVRSSQAVLAESGSTADGDAPVLLACASGSTPGMLHDDVARLADAGAAAVLVLAPHTFPLRPTELVGLHVEVADRSPVPTLVYHVPQLTGSWLTPEAVAELAGHPAILGIKDSSHDPERRAAFAAATRETDGFAVLTGNAPTLHDALRAGVVGSVTAIANLRQRQVTALHRAFADADHERADELQTSLAAVNRALSDVEGSTPSVIKAGLQLEGVLAERWCRPPLESVPPDRLDHVRTALLRG